VVSPVHIGKVLVTWQNFAACRTGYSSSSKRRDCGVSGPEKATLVTPEGERCR
jgi:hypothetical protein